jgi:hypothetical protein
LKGYRRDKDEREDREREAFDLAQAEGKPERQEGPREQEALSRSKPPGSEKGHGFNDGMKSLKRR